MQENNLTKSHKYAPIKEERALSVKPDGRAYTHGWDHTLINNMVAGEVFIYLLGP